MECATILSPVMAQPTSASSMFPVEIWREIIRLATLTPKLTRSCEPGQASNSAVQFNWPHTTSCGVIDNEPPKTKHSLALTSYRFWHMTSEFLYETVHIRRADHARVIATSPSLQDALAKWTKNLIIAPVFDLALSHAEFSPLARQFGEDIQLTLGCCKKLRSLVIRADAVSKRLAMYEVWMKICRAVPLGVQHLDIDDDIHAPSLWEPRHLLETRYDAFLRTLRLTAVQNTSAYDLPNLSHLALYSWPIASKWAMQSLTHLYITYFPNLPRTNTFWTSPKPTLELLHFGHGTDLGSFPDLSRFLRNTTPNLHTLEYYYYGDSEMSWDPSALPDSLKRVTIKTFHHWPTGYKRGQLEMNFSNNNSEPILLPASAERWSAFARHIAGFNVRPTILVPKGTSLSCLEAVIRPIFTERGADACFAESP